MRKLVFTALVLTAVVLAAAPSFGAPRMLLPEMEFDFGLVPQNSDISHVFWIYNQGDDTLKIEKVVPG